MPNRLSLSPELLLRTYFRAKDENRPHLMASVFSESAALEMVVNTGTVSFPPRSHGLAEIADVLVGRFAQTYENVYSFYLQEPPPHAANFVCNWLVGMSEKANGAVRVGCGRYDWRFQQEAPFLVSGLTIAIEVMLALPSVNLRPIMAWLTKLPYPWCPASCALASAPSIAGLEPVLQYVSRTAQTANPAFQRTAFGSR
jgi:hypothetical protein